MHMRHNTYMYRYIHRGHMDTFTKRAHLLQTSQTGPPEEAASPTALAPSDKAPPVAASAADAAPSAPDATASAPSPAASKPVHRLWSESSGHDQDVNLLAAVQGPRGSPTTTGRLRVSRSRVDSRLSAKRLGARREEIPLGGRRVGARLSGLARE